MDLLAQALSLPVAAIKIVRKDRQQRAQKQLKHGSAPRSWVRLLSSPPALPQQAGDLRPYRNGLCWFINGWNEAIFSTDPAILPSGVSKSGKSTMASNSPIT
jgi:hypothetical protein